MVTCYQLVIINFCCLQATDPGRQHSPAERVYPVVSVTATERARSSFVLALGACKPGTSQRVTGNRPRYLIATNSSSDWRNYSDVVTEQRPQGAIGTNLTAVHAVCNTLLEWNSTHYFLAIFFTNNQHHGILCRQKCDTAKPAAWIRECTQGVHIDVNRMNHRYSWCSVDMGVMHVW